MRLDGLGELVVPLESIHAQDGSEAVDGRQDLLEDVVDGVDPE